VPFDIENVRFPSGTGACSGTLYRPAPDRVTGAGVVLAHGFGGVQVGGLQRFAIPFSEAGLTALTFDFRHFGDSSGEPRQLIDMRRQLEHPFGRSTRWTQPGSPSGAFRSPEAMCT